MSKLTSRAKSIIDEIKQFDLANPILNKAVVEECFAEHFRLLGLPMLPVHWVLGGPKEGGNYVAISEENEEWKEAFRKAFRTV